MPESPLANHSENEEEDLFTRSASFPGIDDVDCGQRGHISPDNSTCDCDDGYKTRKFMFFSVL